MTQIEELLAPLEAGRLTPEIFARVGEPEPERALAALARARAHPALSRHFASWVREALISARPALALEQLVAIAELRREAGEPDLPGEALGALARVVGSSSFLARLLSARPGFADELRALGEGEAREAPVAADWEAIREAKYRGLLRIAARDLSGRPFGESLGELSDLADRCLAAGLACAAAETGVAPPTLLALGKLGGRELNFSSDVDVVFVYAAPATMEEDFAHNRAVARLVRAFDLGLEARGPLGFGYRVDLDLRPEGPHGPLANSVEAALNYYESFGAEWERQALIRLRPVAGPAEPGAALLAGVAPFVWRRSISSDALRAVRAMKERIERERRAAGRDLEADLKEGPGGIRDVEFLVQALQLFLGGRDAALRSGNVLEALEALAEAGALPEASASELARGYLWLRHAEHAVQLDEERQTHAFPRDARARIALARRMGYAQPDAEAALGRLVEDWTRVRSQVRAHFDELLPSEEP